MFPALQTIPVLVARAKFGRKLVEKIRQGEPLAVNEGYNPRGAYSGESYIVAYMSGGKKSRYVKLPAEYRESLNCQFGGQFVFVK